MKNNRTALHWAAVRGKWRTCRMLVELGAEAEAKDDDGKTPQMLAAERNFLRAAATIAERQHFKTSGVAVAAHDPGASELKIMCGWGCGVAIPETRLTEHHKECHKRVVPCPLGCPLEELWAKDVLDHQRTECPERLQRCPLKCPDVVKAKNMELHVATQCINRMVKCPYNCGDSIPEHRRPKHQELTCRCRPIPCPEGCEEIIPYNTQKEHINTTCGVRMVRCRLLCNELLQQRYRDDHEKRLCRRRIVPCKWECEG